MEISASKRPYHLSDKGYKFLLSNKQNFVTLLRSFVKGSWVDKIDENKLTKMDKSYILRDFTTKEADLIYHKEFAGGEVAFYVLLEFQSTVDFSMPCRLLSYMSELWNDICNNTDSKVMERKDFLLPAIIPIVLYNGERPWTACMSFRDKVMSAGDFVDKMVDFEYYVIDVNRFDFSELAGQRDFMSLIFMFDQYSITDSLQERFRVVLEQFPAMDAKQQRMMKIWVERMISDVDIRTAWRTTVTKLCSKEAVDMRGLEEALHRLKLRERKEGMEKGLEKGMEKGLKEGRVQGGLRSQVDIARNLLRDGISEERVANYTKLDLEKVKKIKSRLAD